MSRVEPPTPETLARIRTLAERVLGADEFLRQLAIPIGAAEEEEARSLIQWFRRRYPTPAERLAYCRRAYRRWTRTRPGPGVDDNR